MSSQTELTARARAKVNLCLHITGQRPDGYHILDSLVVFPNIGDTITVRKSGNLNLQISGPFGAGLTGEDNAILRAARLLSNGQGAEIELIKYLPLASGIGGGSSDAATTLQLLAQLWQVPLPETAKILKLGADVPVCLSQKPQRMRGIGDVLDPIEGMPNFAIVLVNSGAAVATNTVFKNLKTRQNAPISTPIDQYSFSDFVEYIKLQRNDMQATAIELVPEIDHVIDTLRLQRHCQFARMSGSGATCFGLFENQIDAEDAATKIKSKNPDWWVQSGVV